MLLNGTIQCGGYRQMGRSWWQLSLADTTIEEVAALAAPYEVYEDDGETLVASFADYVKDDVKRGTTEGAVRLDIVRELPAESKKAIEALEANMGVLSTRVEATDAKADEAKEMASQAGADPQVKAASAMYVNAQPLSNTQLADMRDLIEDFVRGAEYEQGWVRRYEGKYYRMAQKITSTTSQTYLPGPGTESLYTLIDLAPDGIRVWHAPTEATNSFALGERCHYPDADGPIYVSGREGNTSEPGTDEWWTLAED